MVLGPTVLDGQVLPLDITSFSKTLEKRSDGPGTRARRRVAKPTDHWHRLLRARHERPAAKCVHQLATIHVWMAPALQEIMIGEAPSSLAAMAGSISLS